MSPTNYLSDLYFIMPAILLFLLALPPLSLKLFCRDRALHTFLSCYSLVALAVVLLSLFYTSSSYVADGEYYGFSNHLVFSKESFLFQIFILLSALLSFLLFPKEVFLDKKRYPEFVFLIFASLLGGFFVSWSASLLVLFISLEISFLPLYALIVITRKRSFSKEGAFKYFILASLFSAMFLLGMALVFGAAVFDYGDQVLLKIIHLKAVAADLSSSYMYQIAGLFLLSTTFFKLGFFPLQNWLPDVYQGAQSSLTFYMTSVVKIISLVFILKIMDAGFFLNNSYLQITFQWLIALTLMSSALFALRQKSIKRLLAYSGIFNSAFLILPFLARAYDGEGGIETFFYYLFTYIFFNFVTFYGLLLLEKKKGSEIYREDLFGLGARFKAESWLLALGVVGLSGLPPLIGFSSKLIIFEQIVENGFYWLAFWAALSSLIALVYYLKVLESLYLYKKSEEALALWQEPLATPSRSLGVQSFLLSLASLVVLYFI